MEESHYKASRHSESCAISTLPVTYSSDSPVKDAVELKRPGTANTINMTQWVNALKTYSTYGS